MKRGERGERGQAGGVEALAFGVLVFVVGTLLVGNAWAVIDAKLAVASAAREGARTYAESGTSGAEAAAPASRAADAAAKTLGRTADVTIQLDDAGYRRCARAVVRVSTSVPVIRLPFIGVRAGHIAVSADHAVLVDPYRSGLPGVTRC